MCIPIRSRNGRRSFRKGLPGCSGLGGHWSQPGKPIDVKSLHAKIGELTLENDFLEVALGKAGLLRRKAMIMREHDLSITKQAKTLSISRGSVYYLPRPLSATDLEIMRHLDRLHLEFPFAGSRMLRGCWMPRGTRSAGVT